MTRLVSGKEKTVPPGQVDDSRYEFLSPGQAEPNLGQAEFDGYVLAYNSTAPGERVWVAAAAASQGATGSQGIQGPQGVQGRDGTAQGSTGGQGSQGIQGPQGVQGAQGIGTQGVQGIQGNGIQGIQGIQGIKPPGFYGQSSTTVDITTGDKFFAYYNGVQKWSEQTAFVAGQRVRIIALTDAFGAVSGPAKGTYLEGVITSISMPSSIEYMYVTVDYAVDARTLHNGTTVYTTEIVLIGNRGIQGPQGIQGAQGLQGAGAQGSQGIQGGQGIQGDLGPQGVQGVQGIQGTGVQGPQGIQGIQGDLGLQGVQGIQGPQGIQGNGIQGPQGIQGIQGIQSVQGPQGVQGVQGVQGLRYSTFIGAFPPPDPLEGDIWWDSESGIRYVWYVDPDSGQWVQESAPGGFGAQGIQGAAGGAISQGAQGLQGAQGIQGIQGSGSQGVQGIHGSAVAQGAQGVQGNQGIQGIQGIQGLSGTAVLQGAQGASGSSGGGLSGTRTTAAATTASIANGVSDNLNITGYATYLLYKITTSAAAWVRLYTTTAARTSDASRLQTVDPSPNSGVIAEVITTGAETIVISPGVIGFNNESSPTTSIPIAVTNNSGSTTSITVTLALMQME